MKKSILSLAAAIIISSAAFAQIPNNSFETWTSAGSYNTPDSWGNLNSFTSFASVYTCIKGTGGASGGGSAYLKLITKNVTTVGVVPGVAVSGEIDAATFNVKSGFPFAQRPQKLTGSWQYMASGSDAGYIAICLTKWNTSLNKRDTVAVKKQNLAGMAMSWATFNITLTYLTQDTPDSAMIVFSASGSTPVAGSYLYVDNISFTGTVTGLSQEVSDNSNLYLYPNPAVGNISVELNAVRTENIKMKLVDATGKLIREVNEKAFQGNNTYTISTAEIPRGIYFLKVECSNAAEVKKVILE